MNIEKKVLTQKYGIQPVHTTEEISLLASKFPNNIKLFSVFEDKKCYAAQLFMKLKM